MDGHGGIADIEYTEPSSGSLEGTLTITLADQSTTELTITNGKGIVSIAKTGTSGLVDTYTITYNDATTTTFTVSNGAKGDTGDAWYVWIRYAGSQPTSDSDIGTTPDDWIGIYSGTASTAPTHYTDYAWFQYKGETGDTGEASYITTQNVSYQTSSSGTVAPSGSWTTTIPTVAPGDFLWTRTQLAFNDGTTVTSYSVARFGIDGSGSVSTVNNVSPDGNGNIALTATDIPMSSNLSIEETVDDIADDVDELKTDLNAKILKATSAVTPSTTQQTYSLPGLTADHELIRWNFVSNGTDVAENLPPCDLTWETGTNIWKLTAGSATSVTCQPVFAIPE